MCDQINKRDDNVSQDYDLIQMFRTAAAVFQLYDYSKG